MYKVFAAFKFSLIKKKLGIRDNINRPPVRCLASQETNSYYLPTSCYIFQPIRIQKLDKPNKICIAFIQNRTSS